LNGSGSRFSWFDDGFLGAAVEDQGGEVWTGVVPRRIDGVFGEIEA
jgi:hypothetical protein